MQFRKHGNKDYLKETYIISGAIVGIVALPLGMAFAIASELKPEQGIYTSIIAGLIVSLLGGSLKLPDQPMHILLF